MTHLSEREVNRRFAALTEQRNNAMNQVVLLDAELHECRATLAEKSAALDAALAMLGTLAEAQGGEGGK